MGRVGGLVVATAAVAATLFFLFHVPAAPPPPSDVETSGTVDYPLRNADADIAVALALARQDGKRVLLDFGADWCLDCKVLASLFRDPVVAAFLHDHFHPVVIDVGEYFNGPNAERNAAVASRFGIDPNETGVPAMVVLDPSGRVVPKNAYVKWSTARRFTTAEVLAYLQDLTLR